MHTRFLIPLAMILLGSAAADAAVRIKDITDLQGARNNQLRGFGLVVGLDGTGSRSTFTQQVAVDMLQKMGVNSKIVADTKGDSVFKSGNISAVIVTAEIGPFAREGSRLDVTVSALDDAKSLQGGTLLFTPLVGADAEVYATAQGTISTGGFAFAGKAASVQKNHPTVGRIANGAIVECEARGEVVCDGKLRILLRSPDIDTAKMIANAINDRFPASAVVLDAGSVQIAVPRIRLANPMEFVSEIGLLEVTPDAPARVVINPNTGTIVAGAHVKIDTVAITQGNLAVVTAEVPEVSQPLPFSKGKTEVVPRTNMDVTEGGSGFRVIEKTVSVGDLARALNALGVTPRDLVEIFQGLKQAGALHAELVIMP